MSTRRKPRIARAVNNSEASGVNSGVVTSYATAKPYARAYVTPDVNPKDFNRFDDVAFIYVVWDTPKGNAWSKTPTRVLYANGISPGDLAMDIAHDYWLVLDTSQGYPILTTRHEENGMRAAAHIAMATLVRSDDSHNLHLFADGGRA